MLDHKNAHARRGYRFVYEADGQVLRQTALLIDDGAATGIQVVNLHGERVAIDLRKNLGFAPTCQDAAQLFLESLAKRAVKAQKKLKALRTILLAYQREFDDAGEPKAMHPAGPAEPWARSGRETDLSRSY
jgi:hypothetical protein